MLKVATRTVTGVGSLVDSWASVLARGASIQMSRDAMRACRMRSPWGRFLRLQERIRVVISIPEGMSPVHCTDRVSR